MSAKPRATLQNNMVRTKRERGSSPKTYHIHRNVPRALHLRTLSVRKCEAGFLFVESYEG